MRKRILFIFLCGIWSLSFGQKESNIWIFADSCGLDFNGTNHSPSFFYIENTNAGGGEENFNAIADSSGDLLFYIGYNPLTTSCGGGTVYNKDARVMDNGSGHSISCSITNGSAIVPIPNVPEKYYLFYIRYGSTFPGLKSLEIDMYQNGGDGKVMYSTDVDVNKALLTEQVIAIQHANGSDWWILTHDIPLNRFYRRLVTKNKIGQVKFQDIGLTRTKLDDYFGEYALGPKSESLVLVTLRGIIEWYRFDRCTGLLSDFQSIGELDPPSINLQNWDQVKAYGCSISPNGNFLYVSGASKLYQYDLRSNDVKGSKTLIWKHEFSSVNIGQHQLGPDGKIYISITNRYGGANPLILGLSIIHQPNKKGLLCDFRPNDFNMQGRSLRYGLPSPPHYGLGPLPLPTADAGPDLHHACPYASSLLGSPSHPDYLYTWEPSTGLSDPHIAQPTASPKTTTTYILTVFDTKHACRNVNTDTITITVDQKVPTLSIDAGPDLAVACPGEKIKLGMSPQAGWWYRWKSDTLVSTDPQPVIQINQPAWYYLIAGNDPANPCEYGIDSIWVDIDVPPLPMVDAGTDRTICPGGGTWLEVEEYANLRYHWQPDSLFADPTLSRQWHRPESSLEIVLQVTDITRSCHNIAFDTLQLEVEQIPYADAGPDMWLCLGLEMSDTIGTTPLPNAQYLWEPASGLSDAFTARPLVYTGADRIYHLMVVKDTFCVSHDSLLVLHKPCDTPYFPNAFSPNGDGINDVFRITNLPGGCVFKVWNRWGRLLFESESYGNDWGAENALEGVYMYRLVEPDGTEHVGSVTIIR